MTSLVDYLELLENSPDIEVENGNTFLAGELGVYDNFALLLDDSYEEIMREMRSGRFEGRYTFLNTQNSTRKSCAPVSRFENLAGTTYIDVEDFVPPYPLPNSYSGKPLKEFRTHLILFDKPTNTNPLVERHRALAEVIADFGKFALDEKKALLLPKSIGHDYPRDGSRLVVYDPLRKAA